MMPLTAFDAGLQSLLKMAKQLEILPPQVFVVGISAIQEKPGMFANASKKEIGFRKVLPLCLAFDRRVLDFGGLVPFISRLNRVFPELGEISFW